MAAFTTGGVALFALLAAEAASLTMVARATRLRRADGWRAELLGALMLLALLAAYTAFGVLLVDYPLRVAHGSASLGVVLSISAAAVLVLLALWRIWPAFGLSAIDTRHLQSSGSSFLRRQHVLSLAWKLTADNEVFFSHGLPVAVCLFALSQGAFVLCGLGWTIPPGMHYTMLLAYALLGLLLNWVIIHCTAHVLLLDRRRAHAEVVVIAMAAEVQREEALQSQAVTQSALHETGDANAMLLRCVRAGQTQLALAALEYGADPNCVPPTGDRDQRSALVLAVLSPDVRLLRGFIAKGADLQHVHAGLPLLIAATRDSSEGRPDAVMTLLTNGAAANCTDADGNSPLHFAALAQSPIVAALLCDSGARLDAVNREGQTPLARACEAANWELARFLLERGAKPEVEHAQPALIAASAVEEDDPRGVDLLIKRKVRIEVRDAVQRTALMTAALRGHARIARRLVEAGARADSADAHGTTALMEAARADACDVLDILMALRPPPDAVDHAGRSALTIAAQSLRAGEETVRRLLTYGISRQIAAADGRRAVDCAAAAGRWNIVALIDPDYPRPSNLRSGPVVADTRDDSPEHLLDALRFGHWQIVETFADQVRQWPQLALADVFCELIPAPTAAGRRWLLSHGLDPDAHASDVRMIERAMALLPSGLAAVRDLIEVGAQPVVADALARTCTAFAGTNAANDGAQALALELLDRGNEAFRADESGQTPLMLSIANGWTRLAAQLLDRGADPQARDRRGRTPLFYALSAPEAAREASIRMLLRAGADSEVRASNNETPLGLALARGQSDLQRWLDWPSWKLPRRRLRDGDVIAAASAGDTDAVGKLLELGLPIDAVDGYGATSLLHAAGRGHATVVTLLLDRGANPTHAASDGATALSAAVAARQKVIVDTLIAHGAAVDQPLAGGGTALMAAAGRGDVEMTGVLLQHGAQANAADAQGMRALHAVAHFAFAGGDAQLANQAMCLLLDAGAAIDARNADGQTALLMVLGAHAPPRSGADQKALLGLLERLHLRGAQFDVQDERGVGPLHACAMHGLLLPARALLAAGADRSARDLLERTPREVAHLLGFVDVATELAGDHARRWAI
ncbi:MAG: ankyrin repeat domain-containing protein [Proteobacteria bacterium]|nr:ankyrin repeat domain-containing protein [Pseudomonadota bacterium]